MPARPEVVVVPTGTANLASVRAALERAGAAPRLASGADDVLRAARLVLPGVGSFGAAMENLATAGLTEALRARAVDGRPLLAICLGLQLLAESSDESPGVAGLALFPGRITRFAAEGIRIPQLGWNTVEPDARCRLLTSGHAYFANSYRLEQAPEGWHAAWSDHGGRFVAALERGRALACQFHPELSGAWGQALVARWLEAA
ncbi:MAG: imidazole glycerol phosphate synthase subunit HisH [Acidobacteria bacterium]|jgi:imidazole glycerol phosphate synthase glutamine amidotransferase subunit|nr:imidazole glycerol phosphate synthase subunit HisH [Acidobacteriota bacterium]